MSSLLPETTKTMNNLDEPSSPLPIPELEPWELPSASLLRSPAYSFQRSSLEGSALASMSPSSPALATSTPKPQGHQSRATATVSAPGIRARRSGSIENVHRPKNYRSPLHKSPSKCDHVEHHRSDVIVHSLATSSITSPAAAKGRGRGAEPPGGDGLGDNLYIITSSDDEDAMGSASAELGDQNKSSKSLVVVVQQKGEMHRLRKEQKMLYNFLDQGRKALIVRKALNAFMYGALRKQSETLHVAQTRVKMKSEECAARLILHSLLLNSYRHTKQDLEAAHAENVQKNKSVENLCLQLRVVRHLQATEKEKIIEKSHEISTLKSEISLLKDEHERSQQKLQALEKQLYEEQNNNDKLSKEKLQSQEELRTLQEKINLLQECLKLEKNQASKYAESSKQLKRQISEAKQQIKDLMFQSTHWQERARTYESENYELEIHVKTGDKDYDELKKAFDDLLEENQILISEKDNLLSHKSVVEAKLGETNNEAMVLKRDLKLSQEELEKQRQAALELQDILNKCRDENVAMHEELFTYKLAHVRKRRVWIQVLMSIINPLETIRLFVCGPTTNEVISSEIAATAASACPK